MNLLIGFIGCRNNNLPAMTLDVLANGILGMVELFEQNNCDCDDGLTVTVMQCTNHSKTDLDFFLVSCSVIIFELKPALPYLICDIYNMLCQCTWLSKQCVIM